MASENQLDARDLGPEPPVLPPLIVDGQAQLENVGGGYNYQVRPEGLSVAGLAHWKWKHRGGKGMPTGPEPTPQAPNYPDTHVDFPDVAEVYDPATPDESAWRMAVMHTLGNHHFDPSALQKRMPGNSNEDLDKIISEMQNRGIIGHPSRAGYEVLQKHGDSPEAIQAVALHLAQVRARRAQNAIEGLERTRQAEHNQGVGMTTASENYNRGANRVLQELQDYASDVTSARHSLNISIPEMHRIINKLEHVGFLRVPITDRGPNFNDDPETNNAEFRRTKKWAQHYAQYERSGSRVYLVGGLDEQQGMVDSVFDAFPVTYDSTSVKPLIKTSEDVERRQAFREQEMSLREREQAIRARELEQRERALQLRDEALARGEIIDTPSSEAKAHQKTNRENDAMQDYLKRKTRWDEQTATIERYKFQDKFADLFDEEKLLNLDAAIQASAAPKYDAALRNRLAELNQSLPDDQKWKSVDAMTVQEREEASKKVLTGKERGDIANPIDNEHTAQYLGDAANDRNLVLAISWQRRRLAGRSHEPRPPKKTQTQ